MLTNNCNSGNLTNENITYINLISSDDSDDDSTENDAPIVNTIPTQRKILTFRSFTRSFSNNSSNNQIGSRTRSSKPTVINLDKTVSTSSNRGKASKKTCIPKKKMNTTPACWTNTNNNRNKVPVKHFLASKFIQRLKLLQRKNCRLISKVKQLMIRKQELQDVQIKYLELKDKVLETEEKLLMNGIDTSEYSAFSFANGDQDTEAIKDNKYDVLLECKLDKENQMLNEPIFIHENSPA
ncbi:uncharacterized protein LOC112599927 [Melanaphis sacchari]|uniref:uncharacterized protein LOC112599927 n=1 Tax=Melanaphis sacchari TaxID=742174 RepID=UPI000DC14107|nr:uncharacterized protein LOC112599927 [Melanaphis sacchari]XP_025202836.1 uncharacterized protein LOC112599927 [Melanaphis sacchari]